MTVAYVYRITFKQKNCKATIKQNKMKQMKRGKNVGKRDRWY